MVAGFEVTCMAEFAVQPVGLPPSPQEVITYTP